MNSHEKPLSLYSPLCRPLCLSLYRSLYRALCLSNPMTILKSEISNLKSAVPFQAEPVAKVMRREIYPKATTPPETEHAPRNTLDFRSSDETLDRYSEFISVAGWKLDNYRKNPVVQNAHSYSSLSDTIGKAIITEVRND